LVDEGANDGDALAFAAGELAGSMRETRPEADFIEELTGAIGGGSAEFGSLSGSVGTRTFSRTVH
jgi:hypothetical protein